MSFWTETEDKLLRELWVKGLPAREISERLPGRTRGAVTGRAEMLKLPSRRWPVIHLATISLPPPRSCEWPHGEVGKKGFHFCAEKTVPGRPYCEAHMKRAYRPIPPRNKDKPNPFATIGDRALGKVRVS